MIRTPFLTPRFICYYFLIFSYLIALSSCQKKTEANNQSVILRYNLNGNLSSLDPVFAKSLTNIQVVHQIFEGLLAFDSNLKVVPCIAKSYIISNDNKTYTFIIDKSRYFHDDSAFSFKRCYVSTSDVCFSFKRLVDPVTASPGVWIFSDKIGDPDRAFAILNDSTFQIRLKKPCAFLPQLLANPYCGIVSKEIFSIYGESAKFHPIGTGPFKLKYYHPKEALLLERVDSTNTNLIKGVQFSFIDNKQNEYLMLLNHKLEVISGLDNSFKDAVLSKEGLMNPILKKDFNLINKPFLNTEYIGFNVDSNLNGWNSNDMYILRTIIKSLIDKSKIIKILKNGQAIVANYGFVPPLLGSKIISQGYTKDTLELALRFLKKKYHSIPAIKFNITANYLDMGLSVQKDAERYGLEIIPDIVTPAILQEMKSKGKALMFRGSWIADYPNAENYYSVFDSKHIPPNGPNYFRIKSPLFDSIINQLSHTDNLVNCIALYVQMEGVLGRNSPIIPIYYDQSFVLASNKVKGLNINALGWFDFTQVIISSK